MMPVECHTFSGEYAVPEANAGFLLLRGGMLAESQKMSIGRQMERYLSQILLLEEESRRDAAIKSEE